MKVLNKQPSLKSVSTSLTTLALVIGLTACNADKASNATTGVATKQAADVTTTEQKGDFYKEDWDSLAEVNHIPEWFQDAKLGLYTHWGPTATANIGLKWPAGWYGLNMYMDQSYDWKTGEPILDKNGQPKTHYVFEQHVKNHGHPSQFGYKDIIKKFNPNKFDAAEWAELFKRSGAKFAGPVAIHHDNFAMWDSEVTRWNVKDFTGIDVTGELKREIEARDMKFITSFHHAFTWVYYANAYKFDATQETSDLYTDQHELTDFKPTKRFHDNWFAILKEVIDKYQPDVIWFDWWVEELDEEYRKKFVAYYYNQAKKWGKDVVINYKNTSFPSSVGVLDYERGRPNKQKDEFWMTDTSPGAWYYYENAKFVEPNEIVDIIIDIVSKNGLMLLNVPPNPDGSIPVEMQELMINMGDWLAVNGEGIYGTRPWTVFGEGPTRIRRGGHKIEKQRIKYTDKDIRFTKKGDDTVYAFVMDVPKNDIVIQTLNTNLAVLSSSIRSIELLGSNEPVKWQRTVNGLEIEKPNDIPNQLALTYKINLYDEAEIGIGGEDPGAAIDGE
ncbi:alpha-L-fucosidase [Saccharobesus litoralis]|uniref:alpha-L-fucosidase n=1 Tax=Saccharobesus litoralis TaxID=2172099 RepID=A0A2S0VXF7_9ALTE|nr:alpha-L-fucosidase [Saccharobesus litoralis]AWB68909.1 alpha-L-fucosidase [Saccharobesus litoralis]